MSEPNSVDIDPGKQPIISKWHQGEQIENIKIGSEGHGEPVKRRVFDTPEGEKVYAFKPLKSTEEAARTFKIYKALKDAGLPVVSFMKTIHKRDLVGVAMEEVSEGDRYSLQAVYYDVGSAAYPILNQAKNGPQLREQMVEALAVMRNLGIYHFHSRTSFFLRVDQEDPTNVDFIILDYSNFAQESDPRITDNEKLEINDYAKDFFNQVHKANLNELLKGLIPSDQPEYGRLEARYRTLVENNVKLYNKT